MTPGQASLGPRGAGSRLTSDLAASRTRCISVGVRRVVVAAGEHSADVPSGAANVAYDCARFLARRGDDVWLVAPTTSLGAPESECVLGVKILRYRVPTLHPLDPRRARVHQEAAKAILRRCVPGSVDVVYGHAPLQYQGACELYDGQARKCYTVHSPVAQEMQQNWAGSGLSSRLRRRFGIPRLNRIERDCLMKSDCITVLSDFTRRTLREKHGEQLDSRIVTIPGWVDLERFVPVEDRERVKSKLGWRAGVPVFFTLRRLVPRMGIDRLLRAARNLWDEGHGFQLVIGGTGPLSGALQQLSDDLGLRDAVRFIGRVSDEDLPLMYGACDAFVLPTAALECFGLIVLEALACGRPVLATPVGAIPEVLSRFEQRWLASSASEESIADIMARFLCGQLPFHGPEELRGVVRRYYCRDLVLSEMARLILN